MNRCVKADAIDYNIYRPLRVVLSSGHEQIDITNYDGSFSSDEFADYLLPNLIQSIGRSD